MNAYQISLISEAVSPITHGAGSAGNESLIVRHDVETSAGRVSVPGISGNSLRNRTLRTPLARHVELAHDLTGKISRDLLYFLYRGGMGGSGPVVRPSVRAEFRRLLPMVRLLGGNLAGGQMLGGDAIVSDGILVCRENVGRLAGHLGTVPGLFPGGTRFKSYADYVGGWQEVAMDAAARNSGSLHPDHRGEAPYGGIPYGGECVVPGAVFVHTITFPADPVLAGAVAFALADWQAMGGGVGGGTARGRGKLMARLHCQGPVGEFDPAPLVQDYLGHVAQSRDDVLALLAEHYPLAKPIEAKAKGNGRKPKGVASGDDAAAD